MFGTIASGGAIKWTAIGATVICGSGQTEVTPLITIVSRAVWSGASHDVAAILEKMDVFSVAARLGTFFRNG